MKKLSYFTLLLLLLSTTCLSAQESQKDSLYYNTEFKIYKPLLDRLGLDLEQTIQVSGSIDYLLEIQIGQVYFKKKGQDMLSISSPTFEITIPEWIYILYAGYRLDQSEFDTKLQNLSVTHNN